MPKICYCGGNIAPMTTLTLILTLTTLTTLNLTLGDLKDANLIRKWRVGQCKTAMLVWKLHGPVMRSAWQSHGKMFLPPF